MVLSVTSESATEPSADECSLVLSATLGSLATADECSMGFSATSWSATGPSADECSLVLSATLGSLFD